MLCGSLFHGNHLWWLVIMRNQNEANHFGDPYFETSPCLAETLAFDLAEAIPRRQEIFKDDVTVKHYAAALLGSGGKTTIIWTKHFSEVPFGEIQDLNPAMIAQYPLQFELVKFSSSLRT